MGNENSVYAALTALLTVGVLLLNLGVSTLPGNLQTGIIMIALGAAMILGAVYVLMRFGIPPTVEKLLEASR